MPYLVDTCFREFYGKINLPGDHRTTANARRESVVRYLKDLNVIDSFATGSIPRYTALSGSSDLDVIVVLHYGNHIKGKKPSQVLQRVRTALAGHRNELRRNGQAVTLYYKTWPNVDVVPVSRVVDDDGQICYYTVPDMKTETWLQSRPRRHSRNMRERAGSVGEKFRQVICMMKHWNRTNGNLLESYHIEAMALQAINYDSEYSWMVSSFFKEMSSRVRSGFYYLGDDISVYLTWQVRDRVVNMLSSAAEIASTAWYHTYGEHNEHEKAIGLWRDIFGYQFPKHGS